MAECIAKILSVHGSPIV